MEAYLAGDVLGRKHYLSPVPVTRHGQNVAYSMEVSRLEADGQYTQLHYFIPALNEQWLTEAETVFYARQTLENYYATGPITP